MKLLLSAIFVIALATWANTASVSWKDKMTRHIGGAPVAESERKITVSGDARSGASGTFAEEEVFAEFDVKADAVHNGHAHLIVPFPGPGSNNTRTMTSWVVYGYYKSLAKLCGGVEYSFVTLNITSEYNRSIDATVTLYGR